MRESMDGCPCTHLAQLLVGRLSCGLTSAEMASRTLCRMAGKAIPSATTASAGCRQPLPGASRSTGLDALALIENGCSRVFTDVPEVQQGLVRTTYMTPLPWVCDTGFRHNELLETAGHPRTQHSSQCICMLGTSATQQRVYLKLRWLLLATA